MKAGVEEDKLIPFAPFLLDANIMPNGKMNVTIYFMKGLLRTRLNENDCEE
jgi:hypothetical protein